MSFAQRALGLSGLASFILWLIVLPIFKDSSLSFFVKFKPDGLPGQSLRLLLALVCVAAFVQLVLFGIETARKIAPPRIVHAILPLTGIAKGDGLIQAAGFLAANKYYEEVSIKFHDHANEPLLARQLLTQIMRDHNSKKEPLWIVATMSKVSKELFEAVQSELQRNPSLKARFSLIMTIAAAPNTPHSPANNFFRYSFDGLSEVEAITSRLRETNPATNNPIAIVPVGSEYPRQTLGQLSNELIISGRSLISFPLDEDGGTNLSANMTQRIGKLGAEKAVVFGYDLALFSALEFIIGQGFKGDIFCSSTLSVPDWQQYLIKRDDLQSDEISYSCLKFSPVTSEINDRFEELLHEYNFNTLTESDVYEQSTDEIRSTFSTLEKEVYTTIEPNYISAQCFESVRMIRTCIMKGQSKLIGISCVLDEFFNSPGPLSGVKELPLDRGYVPSATIIFEKVIPN